MYVLLGYAIRVRTIVLDGDWEPSLRLDSLTEPLVTTAVSVDEQIWPICEEGLLIAEKSLQLADAVYELENEANLISAPYDVITEAVKSLGSKAILIAVGTTIDAYERVFAKFGNRAQPLPDADELKHWQFLGFDLADEGRTSILTNCGRNNRMEQAAWEKRKTDLVNLLTPFGLLRSIDDAQALAASAQSLVPEHSPAIPMGIWCKQT